MKGYSENLKKSKNRDLENNPKMNWNWSLYGQQNIIAKI